MGKKRHITFEKKVLNIRRRGGEGVSSHPTHPQVHCCCPISEPGFILCLFYGKTFFKNNEEQSHRAIGDFPTKTVLRTSKYYYRSLFSKSNSSQNLLAVIQLKLISNTNKIVIKHFHSNCFQSLF